MSNFSIIAGDVGGTKTRLALYSDNTGKLERGDFEQFESAKFKSLEDIIDGFLKRHNASPKKACFGIPGPVINGTVKVTNLPWSLSETEISNKLAIPKVKLVNDLVATAAAIPYFSDADRVVLHQGKKVDGDCVSVVIAPGTGMGQAILVSQNGKHSTLASEGGHANFAPTNKLEFELFNYLEKKYGHVSVERVLCGPGLVNIYDFLRDTGFASEPPELKERMSKEVPAAVITTSAQEGKYELCVKALDMFVQMLGAHASNVMITVLATGGVYLGGGVPPRILKKLTDGSIVAPYIAKGKMKAQVESTPLYVIKDDHAALTGAAHIADQL